MDEPPAGIAADLDETLLALPIELPELGPDVDLEEQLEDARWQTAICRAIVRSIEEEIEDAHAAPEMDEVELDRLTDDLDQYRRLYLAVALEAAQLLELSRRLEHAEEGGNLAEPAGTGVFTLPVVQGCRATMVPAVTESLLAG